MTATLVQGEASGRITRCYIQTAGSLSNPTWSEIVNRADDKATPAKKTIIQQETFADREEMQLEGKSTPPSYEFVYIVKKGVTDPVWTAIKAACVAGAAPVMFAKTDDDITAVGANCEHWPGCWSYEDEERGLEKFNTYKVKVSKVQAYESGTLIGTTKHVVT